MNWQDYIEQRPDVLVGKPVFKGTRLAVEFILERLGDGATEDDLLASYPRLTREHIRAAQQMPSVPPAIGPKQKVSFESTLQMTNRKFGGALRKLAE